VAPFTPPAFMPDFVYPRPNADFVDSSYHRYGDNSLSNINIRMEESHVVNKSNVPSQYAEIQSNKPEESKANPFGRKLSETEMK